MSKLRTKSEDIRKFIINNVEKHPRTLGRTTANHFDITLQAVNKHIKKLIEERTLEESGKTKNKVYKLASLIEWKQTYQIANGLAEDLVWRNDIKIVLGSMPENILDIWHYGFTEMFNNALDHSGGTEITIHMRKTALDTEMLMLDNGIGIFKGIQTKLNLLDERHALLELSKGKLTTDPSRHTGEGIFFTSRVFDSYDILSGGVHFAHHFGHAEDWILERDQFEIGTVVWMKLHNHTARTLKKIFDQFAPGDEYRFVKTVVPVRLAQYGDDKLISRSQAKRLLARIELFKVVIFDFTGVDSIGQAFADEIFRVFASQHQGIELTAIHANADVKRMIERARQNEI